MRKITMVLLMSAYLFIAMIVAALVWRGGAGWETSSAALMGTLGLAFAFHTLVAQGATRAALTRELAAIREAPRLLADALDATQDTINGLASKIEDGALIFEIGQEFQELREESLVGQGG